MTLVYTLDMQVEDDRLLRQAHYENGDLDRGDALLAVIKEKQSIIILRRRREYLQSV